MKLINGNVLFKKVKEEQLKSGIFIPTSNNANCFKAEILNADPSLPLEKGDIVFIQAAAMLHEVETDNYITKAGNILSID